MQCQVRLLWTCPNCIVNCCSMHSYRLHRGGQSCLSQNLDLPYNVVDIMSHLASSGGGHMARAWAWALANLRFPLWDVGHGLGHILERDGKEERERRNGKAS